MYELKNELERYLRVNLLGQGPRFIKKELYRAARGSPGIFHFSFLSIFHKKVY